MHRTKAAAFFVREVYRAAFAGDLAISGPLRDPLIAAGCFAIGLRGSALRAPPIRPMEPTAILSIRQKFYEFSPNACDSRGSSGGVRLFIIML